MVFYPAFRSHLTSHYRHLVCSSDLTVNGASVHVMSCNGALILMLKLLVIILCQRYLHTITGHHIVSMLPAHNYWSSYCVIVTFAQLKISSVITQGIFCQVLIRHSGHWRKPYMPSVLLVTGHGACAHILAPFQRVRLSACVKVATTYVEPCTRVLTSQLEAATKVQGRHQRYTNFDVCDPKAANGMWPATLSWNGNSQWYLL